MTESSLMLVVAVAMVIMLLALAAQGRTKGGGAVKFIGIVAAVTGLVALLLAWLAD